MYPFTHIDAFYQVSRYITKLNKSEAVPESQKIKEPISFRGTIKLHGTNSSVRHTKDGELIAQSRTRVITPVSDNAGFAFFVEKKKDSILEICKIVRDSYGIDPSNDLIIYGEWIGPGVQKGMAINQLPEKQWVLFSFKVIDGEKENYIDIKPSFEEKFKKDNIFSVFDIPQWNITVDFENVESKENAVNQFTKLTDEVEKECPWAKQWNISGLGEGIVWQPIGKFWGDSNLFFKTKGEKHKNTSPKEHKEQLNPEILSTIEEFVKFALTPNRLNQGIDAIKEAGHSLELSSTGHYLKWVGNDVARECCLELEDNKLEWSQVAKAVNENARKYFHQMVQDSK